ALEDRWALHQYLAIFSNLQLQAFVNFTYRANLERPPAIHGERRRGLRQAVAFHDRNSHRAEPFRHIFSQGCATGKVSAAASAKALAYFLVDKLVRQLPGQTAGRFAAGDLLFMTFAHAHSPIENFALHAVASATFSLLPDFFIN